MTELRIAEDLALPIAAVTEPIGMFANRGKGKSNGAHRFVEQLYHAGLPSVVLDVKGDWYGIRSSSDGRGPGLPFLIFGGTHGDVPLEPGSGTDVARFLAEQRVPAIVDLSHFSKTQARRWVMEFAEELYRVNTEPLMLVVDEADVLIPQRLAAELMRLLGAMEDIAKRGRQRGLGILVISQRVADVNKSVTDLLETLFLFAVTGSKTRKALLEWIDDHADPEEAKAVVATLSSLEPGECWVWSPGWLRLLQRIRFLRIETFDSHATPAPGEVRRSLRTMADVDVSALKEAMAETIERAKADDPKELRKRIAELEKQAAARPTEQVVETVVERVEVPVLDAETARAVHDVAMAMQTAVEGASELADRLLEGCTTLKGALAEVSAAQHNREARDRQDVPRAGAAGGGAGAVADRRGSGRTAQRPDPPARREPRRAPVPRAETAAAGDVDLSGPEHKILNALVQFDEGLDRGKLALLCNYHQRAKSFTNALGSLRSKGLVTRTEPLALTDAGDVVALDLDVEPLPTGRELVDWWKTQPKIGGLSGRVLDTLYEHGPMSRDQLAEALEYHPRAKSFTNAVGQVRGLGLVVGMPDQLELTEELAGG